MDDLIEVVDTLVSVPVEAWNALTDGNVFVSHQYLHALHTTGCASPRTGWAPRYLILRRGGVLTGAMLLYAKTHSRGEYVFDQSWAHAYERNGVPYYPKLTSAVPFTPVTGPRILARTTADRVVLIQAAVQLARAADISSIHVLFPNFDEVDAYKEAGFLLREGVQFHWLNDGYQTFDDFLASLTREKRKKIKQDRRKVSHEGVVFRTVPGAEISDADLEFFYHCYTQTYKLHYSSPYLTLQFFRRIRDEMGENLLLIVAEKEGKRIASALNFVGNNTLYGRYWGTTQFLSGLHFETCYMQAIEYCINHSLAAFEGGAQGEHKLARGLQAQPTWSAHWVADDRFYEAIGKFLAQETMHMDDYLDELKDRIPFKKGSI
ncbi:GNAT family N-acetyltransferase [Massilia brevitalea]|uniref:GNAT family N-acetyltransferase n=1 Tax=Massilia brevitalea TaxID=442526 RepID=UPI002805E29E|nr:GNAT family N-acetyltransferase [Massilia brevitalea]